MLSEGDVDAPRVGTFLLTVKAPIGRHHWNRLGFLAVVGACASYSIVIRINDEFLPSVLCSCIDVIEPNRQSGAGQNIEYVADSCLAVEKVGFVSPKECKTTLQCFRLAASRLTKQNGYTHAPTC